MTFCIKTGFHAFLAPHNSWLYGDAYQEEEIMVFRICQVTYERPIGVRHFTIENYLTWFDENKTSMTQNSTMLARTVEVTNHGYNGVSEDDL